MDKISRWANRGRCRAFVTELIREAKRLGRETISLNVMNENPVAIGLYESLGFEAADPQPETGRADMTYMVLKQA